MNTCIHKLIDTHRDFIIRGNKSEELIKTYKNDARIKKRFYVIMKRDNALIRRQVSLLVSKFKLLLKAPEVQTSRSRTCYALLIHLYFVSSSSIINAVSAISRTAK